MLVGHDTVKISEVTVDKRLRRDMGDLDGLANSIREFGLIQPLVLATGWSEPDEVGTKCEVIKLVAGGRRLAAVKRLGWTELLHSRDFVWREELRASDSEKKLRFRAIELEENLKRKDLTWQEQIEGKAKLL